MLGLFLICNENYFLIKYISLCFFRNKNNDRRGVRIYMKAVEIKNISKIFGNKSQVDQAKQLLNQGKTKEEIVEASGATVGVNQASFDIYEGETFVVMGLSGSGKSTLLRMINRLIEPSTGDIKIMGESIIQADKAQLREMRRNKVNMVFQNFGLFPHKTILENTEFGLEIKGINGEERRQRAEKALENAGLISYKDQLPNQLSGGMQQRVGLARALANDPDILLMDEAFSALDPLIRRDMQDELVELQKRDKRTIVFITHDLDEALRIGDRIALMKDGQVVQISSGEDILMNPASGYVERFVEHVDPAKVFTAEHAMQKPEATVRLGKDGARVAARRMQANDYDYLLVVDDQDRLVGYVTDSDMAQLIRKNPDVQLLHLSDHIHKDMPTVGPETPIKEMYDLMHQAKMPITVLDDEDHLLGIISRRMIIEVLAGEGGGLND